jgi:hypothetical protein
VPNPAARAVSALSGSGFCRRHASIARRNSAPLSRLEHRVRKTPDLCLGVPAAFEQGPGGFAEDFGQPVFLHRQARSGGERRQVEQVRDGIRTRSDRGGAGGEGNLPFQRLGRIQLVGAAPEPVHRQNEPREEFVGEPQERGLQFSRIDRRRLPFSGSHGPDRLGGNLGGGLQQPAAGG